MMRKPKFINRPEETTVKGTPRQKRRSLTKEEIDFLKKEMHIRFAKENDLTAVQWNFDNKFGWRPDLLTLRNFYSRKTYQWAWDNIDDIPIDKRETAKRQIGIYDAFKTEIMEGLQDPYFGSNEQTFYEYLQVFVPKIVITDNLFFYLRKKFGICPQSKQKTNNIVSRIVENKEMETPLLYELINKEFGLNFNRFNYYCRKAEVKHFLTENKYKKYIYNRKDKSLSVKFEMRYSIDGKFFVEEIELPKKMVDSFRKKILKQSV